MQAEEIKKIIIGSLDVNANASKAAKQLDDEGLSFDFREGFTDRVIGKIFTTQPAADRELDFIRNLNFVFKRIALTGVAAIVLLFLSILIAEGSFSLNSFLGLGNVSDESIVCLLTSN